MNRADRYLLFAFAFVHAVLYSSLLPLWEGFDEPWHYGYVQTLASTHQFPVLGKTRLSREVWGSMLSAPASHVVAHAWPELQTFDRYFALSPADRARRRSDLQSIPPADRGVESAHTNYEAQQPPLAYALLVIPDLVLYDEPVPQRVLWLRITCAVIAFLITFYAAISLFRTLHLPACYQALGLFCIFACQMYWATVAHIANDALGLALAIWFLAAGAAFAETPHLSGAIYLALATALGLLTKAYFLPLCLLAACLVAWRNVRALPAFALVAALLAGPWYARNLSLYHNGSGLLMASGGATPGRVLSSLGSVQWSRAIPYMLRATLWTGNNSFTSFSSLTLNCLLALLAAGVVMYLLQARKNRPTAAEWSVIAFLVVYGIAVILVVGNDVIFLNGASAGAAPWYTELLLPPVLAIAFLGLSRTRGLGLPVSLGILVIWTYLCCATYLVKLIPLYGGYSKGRMTLGDVVRWYQTSLGALTNTLSTISLAPPILIYAETVLLLALAVSLAIRLLRELPAYWKTQKESSAWTVLKAKTRS